MSSAPQQYNDDQLTEAVAAFAAGEVTYLDGEPAQLPEPPDTEPMVPLGIRVTPALEKRIREAAAQEGRPYSQLIREWIEVGLTDRDTDQVVAVSALRRAIAHVAQTGHAA